jgi:hypothetical protein
MTHYCVIVAGQDTSFFHDFDGEPQINLTFEQDGHVYKVVTRAHDEDSDTPMLHAELI